MLRAESDGRNPEHAPHWLEDAGAEMRLAPQTCRVERLVERSRVSRPHFSGRFRALWLTASEYRTAHRLLSAVKQLLQTDTPIAEIAHDCGFADQSHLTRTLRSKLGVTPTHLRKSAAGASADDFLIVEEERDLALSVLEAVGGLWTELASIDSAKRLRMVPSAAFAGLVAPITSRYFATALSPSSA